MDWIADFLTGHRRQVAWVILIVSAVTAWGTRYLGFDDDPRNLFRTQDPEYRQLEAFHRAFGSTDHECTIAVESADLFSPDGMSALRRLVDAVRQVPGVQRVDSMLDVVVFDGVRPRPLIPPPGASQDALGQARARALRHPLVGGQILSDNGRMTLVFADLGEQADQTEIIRPILGPLHDAIARSTHDTPLRATLTGIPPLRAEIYSAMRADQQKFVLLGVLLGNAMAIVLFRRPTEIIIVGGASMLGALWTMGALGLVGEQVNPINLIIPVLVMVIGFADAVHLMLDIERSRAGGLEPIAAARSTIRHLGLACLLAALTTAVGFGSLVAADLLVIQRLGIACAAGAGITLAAVLLFVPWAASGRFGRFISLNRSRVLARRYERIFSVCMAPLTRHASAVVVVSVLVTTGLVVTALRLRPDNSWGDAVPDGSEAYAAWQQIDDAFGGAQFVYAVVEWPVGVVFPSRELLGVIGQVEGVVSNESATVHPVSILSVLESLPGADTGAGADDLFARAPLLALAPESLVHRFVSSSTRQTVVAAHVRDTGKRQDHQAAFDTIGRALSRIQASHPGYRLYLTGTAVVAGKNLNKMILDLARSLMLAAVVIFGTMTLAFRSLRLGIISVIPNIFPLALTGALMVAWGQSLQITSVIVFSMCLGIAVDDTIHFIARYRREFAVDGDPVESVHRAFVAVGSAIVTTTAVLLVGFGSVFLSRIPSLRTYSVLCCLAISSALIGDLLILPALLIRFGRGAKVTEVGRPPEVSVGGGHTSPETPAGA